MILFRSRLKRVWVTGGRISRVAGVGRLVGGDREDAPGGRVPHGLRALAHDHLLVHLPWRVHREDGRGERSRSQLLLVVSAYVQQFYIFNVAVQILVANICCTCRLLNSLCIVCTVFQVIPYCICILVP